MEKDFTGFGSDKAGGAGIDEPAADTQEGLDEAR